MSQAREPSTDVAPELTGIAIAACYVDDFAAAYEFYTGVLGLKKLYDLGERACCFSLGDGEQGLYLEGGCTVSAVTPKSVRASFLLRVNSASALHRRLSIAGTRCVQTAPMGMGGEDYWFQFYDPSGNLLEALGPK